MGKESQGNNQPMRIAPRGAIPYPVTPCFEDGRVDYATFEKLINFHIKHGASSLYVVLHIAESLNLTFWENAITDPVSI